MKRVLAITFMFAIIGMSGSMFDVRLSKPDSQTLVFVDNDNVEGPWYGTMEHPYQNISSGIEQASALDTVFVCNGAYFENVVVNKTLSLIGENPIDTIIDGGKTGSVVCVEASNTNIDGFTIRNSGMSSSDSGVKIVHSSGNNITNNIITNNCMGIRLYNSSNITLSHNQVLSSVLIEVLLHYSNYSILTENTVSSTKDVFGIQLTYSNYNTVNGNNVSSCAYGIRICDSNNNTVTANNLFDNRVGIRIDEYYGPGCYNTLRDNNMTNNEWNFQMQGSYSRYLQDVDTSNTIDGKPIYYWVDKHDMTVPSDAGYVALVNCTRITVTNLDLRKNGQGVLLAFTTNSTITKNNITRNKDGISIGGSNNTVSDNTVRNNGYGILLEGSSNIISANNVENNGYGVWLYNSSGNMFYHNNFMNNDHQIHLINSVNNTWDNGCEGNYWSDYNGTDVNGDGVGDTELPWSGVDHYPLMNPYWNPADVNHDLKVDIYDVVLCCRAYGSTPSDPNWNPHCDIASPYTIINIHDVVVLCNEYGKTSDNP
jgi:parallel beta-helix repeat protein